MELKSLDARNLFHKYWANSTTQLDEALQDFIKNRDVWKVRYENNKHALLFMLKRKSGITKYYAGWNVFVKLAANNIRYLLELVDQA